MRTQPIPRTDLEPSVICLGTSRYGTHVIPEDVAVRLLDAYVEHGGTFIDTAHYYSDWATEASSVTEKLVGRWLRQSGMAERVVLATKGGHQEVGSQQTRVTPSELYEDLMGSLEHLDGKTIDLYWLHRDRPDVPVGELLDFLEEQRAKGHFRYYGCSNWQAGRIKEAAHYAAENGCHGFVANQLMWSLADLSEHGASPITAVMDDELYEHHRESGMAAVPYTSQAKGFFGGKYGPGKEPETGSSRVVLQRIYNETNFGRLARAEQLAGELGRTAGEVALAYLTSQPFPTFPIVGCRTLEQLEKSCAAADLQLTAEQRAFLHG